jgi:hypothetical protein
MAIAWGLPGRETVRWDWEEVVSWMWRVLSQDAEMRIARGVLVLGAQGKGEGDEQCCGL